MAATAVPANPITFAPQSERASASGKFLCADGEKFYIRGVTYGPFAPDSLGNQFFDRSAIRHDFEKIERNGFNAIRIYSAPPLWLLDIAREHGLRVMVGLAWEQHVAFLDDK